jgi:cell wall-associated NlpC family hydrolase
MECMLMPKIIITTLIIITLLNANYFSMSGENGKGIQVRTIKHKNNAYIYQDVKVYSYQAFQAEIQQQKVLAMQNEARIAMEEISSKTKSYSVKSKPTQQAQATNGTSCVVDSAKQYKGGKYVWGGTRPEGFDCSGYTQFLYGKHGIKLPRTAYAQSKVGQSVSTENLRQGDLLFFLTDKNRGVPVTHVGIYAGNGEFIHAASKDKGIIISPLKSGSYAKCFVGAKRVAS